MSQIPAISAVAPSIPMLIWFLARMSRPIWFMVTGGSITGSFRSSETSSIFPLIVKESPEYETATSSAMNSGL